MKVLTLLTFSFEFAHRLFDLFALDAQLLLLLGLSVLAAELALLRSLVLEVARLSLLENLLQGAVLALQRLQVAVLRFGHRRNRRKGWSCSEEV